MNRILFLIVFLNLIIPALAIAMDETSDSNDFYIEKTQSLIDKRIFLTKGGVEQMLEYSTNLEDKSKDSLYKSNRKNGSLGWLSLPVPSLGNWLVGDRTGGIVSVTGFVCGFVLFDVGS